MLFDKGNLGTPCVNIRITREGGTTAEQQAELISRFTNVLTEVPGESPATTVVVIDGVE